MQRDIFSVHQKFSTSLDNPRNQTIFHFRANHSQLETVLMSRVFSKESFSITFSTNRAQDDLHLTFSFQQDRTTLTGSQTKVWKEKSIFEFGKLNDFMIEVSSNSIVFKNNQKGSGSITVDGTFQLLKFIGFYSEKLSTWIVSQSKIVDIRLTELSPLLVIVSPRGVVEISAGEDVNYHDVIDVTCTEKQHGRKTLNRPAETKIFYFRQQVCWVGSSN